MQLKGVGFCSLLYSRIKKLVLDMTSVKFEFVIFVGYCIWAGKISPVIGLPTMMVALGMREYVDFLEKKNGK